MHWLVVIVIALIVFGPKRLPELGRSLGSGIRGFKDSLEGKDEAPAEQAPDKAPAADITSAATTERTRSTRS